MNDKSQRLAQRVPKYRVHIIREHGDLVTRGCIAETLIQLRDQISARFRWKRMARFEQRFPVTRYDTIVDVGGTFSFWEGYERNVTLVNPKEPATTRGTVNSVPGDGRSVPFPDKAFTLAFSNSVIEHMPNSEDMYRFVRELSRLAPELYCQAPSRWFFFEPHYMCLFLHWWPRLLRNYFIVRYLTGFGWAFRPDREVVAAWANEVKFLDEKQFSSLFQGCDIERETFLGMTKSFIARGACTVVSEPGAVSSLE